MKLRHLKIEAVGHCCAHYVIGNFPIHSYSDYAVKKDLKDFLGDGYSCSSYQINLIESQFDRWGTYLASLGFKIAWKVYNPKSGNKVFTLIKFENDLRETVHPKETQSMELMEHWPLYQG